MNSIWRMYVILLFYIKENVLRYVRTILEKRLVNRRSKITLSLHTAHNISSSRERESIRRSSIDHVVIAENPAYRRLEYMYVNCSIEPISCMILLLIHWTDVWLINHRLKLMIFAAHPRPKIIQTSMIHPLDICLSLDNSVDSIRSD